MIQTPLSSRRRVAPADLRDRPGTRRWLSLSLLGVVAAAVLMLTPALASADSASSLSIVGTSDVSDSGLMPDLIQPQFQAAFPQFTFKYTGSATGAAIQSAESGNGGPSVLIVHAASLENQFVAGGFSYQNKYGNAIFTNDFILAGPATDPAGVKANAPNNIAQAFADVAAAGVNGAATFISRGGAATASGTTVEEHTIWGLVNSAGLTPAGVALCNVSAADGGGMSPVKPSVTLLAGNGCPDGGTVTTGDNPSWYSIAATGTSQGMNLVNTNACTGVSSPSDTCYSLTDRASFDFLVSKNSPAAGTTGLPNLAILTRDNSASAPGGADALINYFHAYIINPSSPGETVNLTAAQDFISFITSPTIQSELKGYLANTPGDGGGPPFVADASPAITAAGFPTTIAAGKSVTVTGSVTNLEPGFPALAAQTVSIDELEGLSSVPVASGSTNSAGGYSITFTPPSSGSYQASTGDISQVENASLSPVYGDILSPSATSATSVTVTGSVTITKDTASPGGVSVTGSLAPTAPDGNGTVDVLARKQGSKGGFVTVGSTPVKTGAKAYAVNGTLGAGKWQIETRYQDKGEFNTATSGTRNLTVSGNIVTVTFKKVSSKKGKVTVSGVIGQPPASSGGKLELFALKNGTRSFKQVGKASIGKGKTKFTVKAKLKAGSSYALQLQYVHKGQTSSYSKLKTVAVH
jgi:tungstate transport system substrate-binding protein